MRRIRRKRRRRKIKTISVNYLAKISFNSCSETNCPKLATNKVEHGALAAKGGFGCCDVPVEPTGLANAGLGKKWPGGKPADTCICCGCIADGCCNVIWFWNEREKTNEF